MQLASRNGELLGQLLSVTRLSSRTWTTPNLQRASSNVLQTTANMSNRSRSQSVASTMSSRSRSRSHSTLRQAWAEWPTRLTRSNRASRSCSPAAPNRRIAKLNMYLARSAASSNQDLHRRMDIVTYPPRTLCVKRWDGNSRTVTKWDSIRKVRDIYPLRGTLADR